MKTRITKNLLILLVVQLCTLVGFTQSPQGFSYQAVVRDGSGNPIAEKKVGMEITLQSAAGVTYYTEVLTDTTSEQGVISVTIGAGTQVGGGYTFASIPWSTGDVYIKVAIDPAGGTNYTQLGKPAKLQSVPYALYAENTKEVVSQLNANDDDPIFVVRNKAGQVVFAVYQTGVRVNVEDTSVKGARGGFAVGGLSGSGKGDVEYLRITPDSARVFVNEVIGQKGARGGFAVGGLSGSGKATSSRNLMFVAPDSTRVYIDDLAKSKGARGGFAVGGLSGSGKSSSSKNFFNISAATAAEVIQNESRVMWYPKKSALLAGEISVEHPDSVGQYSVSLGYHNIAKGGWSQAMGYKSVARGSYSTAIGYEAVADTNSFSFGHGSRALGKGSFAFGAKGVSDIGSIEDSCTEARGNYSFAFGLGSKAVGLGAVVLGVKCKAIGNFSTAMGLNTRALGLNSFAFGGKGITDNGTIQPNNYTTAKGNFSFAFGLGSKAIGLGSFVLGVNCEAGEKFAFATGFNSKASGINSVAMGVDNVSSGEASFTMGSTNTATAQYAFAFGANNVADGVASLALGLGNTIYPSGLYAIVGGNQNNARGSRSFAMGFNNNTNGDGSIAMGTNNTCEGINAAAFGDGNTSNGTNSFAIGQTTTASSSNSFAMGNGAQAMANNAIAIGNGSKAIGQNSLASGYFTTAQAFASLVIGQFNLFSGSPTLPWVPTDPLFVAGNGSGTGNRSNAMVLYKNGNLSISGALDLPVKTITTSTTLDATNHTVFVNTSITITITLPLASTCPGRIYVIKKVTTTGGSITIARSGADLIDEAASQSIPAIWGKMVLQSDGTTNWFIIN